MAPFDAEGAASRPLGVLAKTALKSSLQWLAAGDNRLTILIYHSVNAQRDALFPNNLDAATFDWHLGVLGQLFNVMPLSEAVAALKTGKLAARSAAITFDDGYLDNADIALPVLLRHRMSATFFVASAYLSGGLMWNDRIIESVRRAAGDSLDLGSAGLGVYDIASPAARRATISTLLDTLRYLPFETRDEKVERIVRCIGTKLPTKLMMDVSDLQRLHRAGMEIGAHTVNHPILARLDTATARAEIAASKRHLEEIIGEPVTLFAYPNGRPGQDYLAEHAAMVRELGFSCAVSTAWGAAHAQSDLYQLPRFTPWDTSPRRFALRLARNLVHRPIATV